MDTATPAKVVMQKFHVTFQHHSPPLPTTIEFSHNHGPKQDVQTDANGSFSVPLPDRSVRYWIKHKYFLGKAGIILPNGGSTEDVKLLAGDFDNSNDVGNGDRIRFNDTYGKSKDQPGYLVECNLNDKDDVIDTRDFNLFQANYGLHGDMP